MYNGNNNNNNNYKPQKHRPRRNNMSQGKSAYEIRANLLELAFRIKMAEHDAKAGAEAKQGAVGHFVTTAPTTDEVVAEAEKLNDFVSTQTAK